MGNLIPPAGSCQPNMTLLPVCVHRQTFWSQPRDHPKPCKEIHCRPELRRMSWAPFDSPTARDRPDCHAALTEPASEEETGADEEELNINEYTGKM
jgi:hypothetical protein